MDLFPYQQKTVTFIKRSKKEKMDIIQMHDELLSSFNMFFSSRNYCRLLPVGFTSQVDKSVYLINSATNLFKQYLDNIDVHAFAIQPSMRTQNLLDFYREETETEYPTCFVSYGAYSSINNLSDFCDDCVSFFESIGFIPALMRIRASSADTELIKAVESTHPLQLQLDMRSEKYDHYYGQGITGRAIKIDYYQNFLLRYKNLCYIIIISEDGLQRGVELATSDQLILMRLNNKRYGVSVAKIASLLPTNTFAERRFADSIVGISNLLREGIRPNSSNTNGRTLKKYIDAAHYFGSALDYTNDNILEWIACYYQMEYFSLPNVENVERYLRKR